ncbi:MAG: glycosyltransferase family 4 protein [Cytophagales bacterium]|nr:glycosyltransferase family 4 protein [Cytophagales bacterium]
MSAPLKILMLCWEYPPLITGGLGNASGGLANALVKQGHEVEVLLPKVEPEHDTGDQPKISDLSQLILDEKVWVENKEVVEKVKDLQFGVNLLPYLPPQYFTTEREREVVYTETKVSKEVSTVEKIELEGGYGEQLMGEIQKYALLACQKVQEGNYDIVHANDWMTFRAGSLIQKLTKAPVVFHVHSVESDRNGLGANPEIAQIEKEALIHAQYIVSVSKRLQKQIARDYGVNERKIEVVPNGVSGRWKSTKVLGKTPVVGFIGRLTHQKGPSYFLDVARELRSKVPGIKFMVIGDGYLKEEMKAKAQRLNLPIVFTNFLEGKELTQARNQLDLLIVPSLSEPFGLVILEGMQAGIPTITTKNTGIAESIPELPQLEPWDTFQLTRLSERLLSQASERKQLMDACQKAGKKLTWKVSAKKVTFLYEGILQHM